ncbi:proton channel OtopLc-like [Anneissia japonica]|uniref:proton channel OtopLc-like n=1 Tax=Anneissia japonica TaxID=1529436 RepID=UPI0014256946|nr:proton channel OtopLc-like [Anneissia japonica]
MDFLGNIDTQHEGNRATTVTERIPILHNTTSHRERFHMSALFSGLYGMLIYLFAIVLLTAGLAQQLETPETFNIYTIVVYIVAIAWIVGDIIYLKVNKLSPVGTEMSMASSLHVKGGIVTFGFTSILMSIIDIWLKSQTYEDVLLYEIGLGMRIIFFFAEIIYLINFSNICVTSWSALRRFGLMHVMVTNFKDMTMHVIIDSGGLNEITTSKNSTNTTNSSLQSMWNVLEPYLDVCRIQYCFIAAATVAIMWNSIGNVHQVKTKDVVSNGHYSSWNTSIALILGFAVITGTVASLIISSSLEDNSIFLSYYYIRVTLNFITLYTVTVLLAVSRRSNLGFRKLLAPFQLDELIIGLCLVFYTLQEMYSSLSLIVAIYCSDVKYEVLTSIDQLLTLVRIVIQTVLIVQSLRLKVSIPIGHWFRSMLLFFSMSNLAWWIIALTELNNNQHIYETQKNLYGRKTYEVIHGITGPFVVFYYYQSSVCFFEMWMTNNLHFVSVKIAHD